jgi:hypothetical protein
MATEWSCLIFMAADNNLRVTIDDDLKEMATACSDHVGVAVELDVTKERTRRLVLHGNELVTEEEFDNVNSGDPNVVTSFLKWGQERLDATKHAVILWGHGSGFLDFQSERLQPKRALALTPPRKVKITGINLDGTSKDFLDGNETRQALTDALPPGRKFCILGCDACYMAVLEVAHELRDCAAFFIGSEEMEENDGWPYAGMLGILSSGASPEDAARAIVAAYGAANNNDRKATLSALRLDRMDDLASRLDRLGLALGKVLPRRPKAIQTARANTKNFSFADYIDLGSFVRQIEKELSNEPAVVAAVREVIEGIDGAVLAANRPPEVSDVHGIGIYLPEKLVDAKFKTISLAEAAPHWASFVIEYGESRCTVERRTGPGKHAVPTNPV